MRDIYVLIACEESQRVCTEFRKRGFQAFSCDIIPCSGGHPEWHIKEDCLPLLDGNVSFTCEDGSEYHVDKWDMIIAHPPCTYLSVSGAQWYYHPEDKDLPVELKRPHPKFPERAKDRENAAEFFMKFINAPAKFIAVENPIGIMNSRYRKPDQIVQPYYFGDAASKSTCLWLKNLPLLNKTDVVDSGEWVCVKSGKKLPKWYSDALTHAKTADERRKLRSKTFPGIARAMAEQWGDYLKEVIK